MQSIYTLKSIIISLNYPTIIFPYNEKKHSSVSARVPPHQLSLFPSAFSGLNTPGGNPMIYVGYTHTYSLCLKHIAAPTASLLFVLRAHIQHFVPLLKLSS